MIKNIIILVWSILVIIEPGFFPLWYEHACFILLKDRED